jgi:hypothetical protein
MVSGLSRGELGTDLIKRAVMLSEAKHLEYRYAGPADGQSEILRSAQNDIHETLLRAAYGA